MLAFERLVLAYLGLLVLAAPWTKVPRRRQVRAALATALAGAAVVIAARALSPDVRMWLPLIYVPLGYWLPAMLAPPAIGTAFEAWLVRTDDALRRYAVVLPRWLEHLVELAYLACYPLLPAAFVATWSRGTPADLERFWQAVLIAAYVCYVTLPWLVSRPPRFIERGRGTATPITRVNQGVLGLFSHQLTTFPSGHVAVAVAAAMIVSDVWWPVGVGLWLVAAGIAVGAVAGRYHFTLDVVLGAAAGALAAMPWVPN
jgi:membrane-associated phospholipid phosphatase